ncbi:ABC transporter ATP-binding protein [Campylobacter sp. RM9344]|uniref:ABC transporter ATP-binding protein n=1 Tax=Campylobacter californiensis TaxID=1032243 RepID=A0AAW3ZXS0_9BACT|nr:MULTISPECIES: ABC transporter ATP-binding protein [unclassified Campylobacter]MBE2984998.1 ABC transporter ATP-binding protein [Campylobacter sp. RM6883]MBE2995194.1 ABC transporter ATP-binding protein [Campylobacter sp. RM6913]MBE3029550.1 ABC transporter ATP-binding protein [Campylobacter sp. RM9344]MBE3608186.1 ABC transporter ATP-binding protein [Campylobacter sp. RM9337]QCD51643.1 ferric siderophore ABC transporter, ATP-binding protein [Campylobacter sp. RM6914]
MLNTENLGFKINNKSILTNLNLKFQSGKIYGLIGHNGSGKSSLIKILANQQKGYEGKVWLDDKNINEYHSKEFAKKIAYLPQTLPNTAHLNGYELVSMGRYAHQSGFIRDKEKDDKIVLEALKDTNTLKFKDQEVATLSGGEKSRLFLAMLLAQESKFLLLDEPLAPLDISYQIEVMQLIQKLSKERNLGIIIVIHDINLASVYCDDLIALKGGTLTYNINAKNIMNCAYLQNIYGIKASIITHPVSKQNIAVF